MKFRKDFVTNSSSSSYICEICGYSTSGWDMSLTDADLMECVNGHIFCSEHALELPSKREMIKQIMENEWNKGRWDSKLHECRDCSEQELELMDENELFAEFCSDGGHYEVPEFMCPICQFVEYSEYDLSKYLLKEYKIPRDEVFAEVKQINKRRKKLYENEYITYVCKKFNLVPAEIVNDWKRKFSSYAEFRGYLNA